MRSRSYLIALFFLSIPLPHAKAEISNGNAMEIIQAVKTYQEMNLSEKGVYASSYKSLQTTFPTIDSAFRLPKGVSLKLQLTASAYKLLLRESGGKTFTYYHDSLINQGELIGSSPQNSRPRKYASLPEKHAWNEKIGAVGEVVIDTVLTDTLSGQKLFFRIGRKGITSDFGSTTDVLLDCINEADSTVFQFRDTIESQDFSLYRLQQGAAKVYLLHIEEYPSAPPTGNSMLVIAPVSGVLKIAAPGRISFSGELRKPEGSGGDSEVVCIISVWNGNYGIPLPIRITFAKHNAFLNIPFKRVRSPDSEFIHFPPPTSPPDVAYYKEHEMIMLIKDSMRKRRILVVTPTYSDFNVLGIRTRFKETQRAIQALINACENRDNSLLEVEIGGQNGFLELEDLAKTGYQDAG